MGGGGGGEERTCAFYYLSGKKKKRRKNDRARFVIVRPTSPLPTPSNRRESGLCKPTAPVYSTMCVCVIRFEKMFCANRQDSYTRTGNGLGKDSEYSAWCEYTHNETRKLLLCNARACRSNTTNNER